MLLRECGKGCMQEHHRHYWLELKLMYIGYQNHGELRKG